jgi:integrase
MAEERPAAAADAERTASRLIIPQLGRKRLADLATEDITAWRNALAKEPARLRTRPGAPQNFKAAPTTKEAQRARKATVNRVWTTLRAALNRAFKSGHVQDDLAWRRVEPFKKVSARRPGHLSVAECKRLINAADPASGFRDLVQAALSTGCRFGELSALDVRDFQRGKLHIRTSKSGRPRDVVLSDEGIKFFERLAAGRPGNEPMLMRNGGRWQKSEQARPMREACKHAKITPAVGFHALRHSWASLAVMNAMPLMVVARNLGHADTRMVELHYGHLAESYIDKEIRDAAPVFGLKRDKKVAALPR